jgi:hypothetical protein
MAALKEASPLLLLGLFLCATFSLVFGAYPPSYVPVPGGHLFHSSCVHELEEHRAHVDTDAKGATFVTYSNGTRRLIPPCPHKVLDPRSIQSSSSPDWEENGWIAWALAQNTAGFSSFTSQWKVPAVPPKKQTSSEVLFWWNGLVPADLQTVIQPVLQWGTAADNAGKYYSIASWWVNAEGQALYSKPMKVNPGDALVGTLTLLKNSSWSITIVDSTQKLTGQLIYTAKSKVIYERGYYALESYALSSCSSYPEPKPMQMPFHGVEMQSNGKSIAPTWVPGRTTGQAMCQETFTVPGTSSGQDLLLSWASK